MLRRKVNNRRDHRENEARRAAEKYNNRKRNLNSGSLRKISANSAVKMYLRNISI